MKKNTDKDEIDIFKTLQKVDNSVEIIEHSAFSNIKEWIPTGNYILNACISGDLFKGIPTGRVTTLAGPSGTAKSYLACSICREAQKMGYTPVYLDSEGAIDATFVERLGCDPEHFLIKQVNTIKEVTSFIVKMCDQLQDQIDKGKESPKIILVLDSLGELTSDKERSDALTGNTAVDFTKAKDTKALFRVCIQPISRLQIPWIVTNHVYANPTSFTGQSVMSNGSGIQYAGSVTLNLTAAKLKDKENDKAAGKKIGSESIKKNGVLISACPDKSRFCIARKVKFQIPYFKRPNPFIGLQDYMTWDNCGVVMGKCLEKEEFDALSESEQKECYPFTFEDKPLYAWPKEQARAGVGMVVRHLGKAVKFTDFWSDKVFTNDFLKEINDNIIHPLFQLPDQSKNDDIKELEKELQKDSEDVSGNETTE